MRRRFVGIAASALIACAGPAFAIDMTEEIQEEEQPGSEIELDIGGGGATIHRKDGQPLLGLGEGEFGLGGGEPLQPLDDPDDPVAPDPIDAELPGEGPEDLSGPFDEDPLPE
jgi:hypothetical protein